MCRAGYPLGWPASHMRAGRPEKCGQAVSKVPGLPSHFTFPNHHHPPPGSHERCLVGLVPLDVPLEFVRPPTCPRLRKDGVLAVGIRVSVPKTPTNFDYCAPARKNDIRSPREVAALQAVAVTHRMQQSTNHHLRHRVLALNGPQVPATRRCDIVKVRPGCLMGAGRLGHGQTSSTNRAPIKGSPPIARSELRSARQPG